MALDVVDLRSFYATPLGRVARRFVGRIVRDRWTSCAGFSILGVGYATPYLGWFRDEAVRVLAFMPAEQGVVNWPEQDVSSSALVDVTMMPLPDGCIDRVIVIHVLEVCEAPRELLAEIWRILTPGGRMLLVAPNRRGLWSQRESTPFGQGQPYSRSQLRDLLREALFSPTFEAEALYVPPFERPLFLRAASAFERFGGRFALPGGGVHVIEATKQLYRLVGARKAVRRALPQLQPALAPTPAGRQSTRGTYAAR
jgi:SAM-dependent methyltransferase